MKLTILELSLLFSAILIAGWQILLWGVEYGMIGAGVLLVMLAVSVTTVFAIYRSGGV